MSGFQIPGLGHAKDNEDLPPLSSEKSAAPATNDVSQPPNDTEIPDATMENATKAEPASAKTISAPEEQNQGGQPGNPESMAIDRPESPPSLTGALEAHLGGLVGTDNAEQVLAGTAAPQSGGEPDEAQEGNPEWEADSSPYESSSESSSSDSSSEEDSDNEGYELLGVEETARMLMEAEGGSDDEGGKGGKSGGGGQLRTENEMAEEVIPLPDVTITPEMKVEELGTVEQIVENMLVIKAITHGEYQVLDTGSVLCNVDRVVVGAVSETIGKVIQPLYTVRYSNEEQIKELGVEIGTKIFYPVDHAAFVFTEPLKSMKGTDASNLHDEEVGADEMEFSDDEKEQEYKRSLKKKKRKKAGAGAPGRGGRDQPHPSRQEMGPSGELNYDDDDGPYKPLTRPPGFGSGPVSQETYEPPRNFRGRGRGDHRGRGDRGRGSNRGGGRGGAPRDGYSMPPQGSNLHWQQPQQNQHQAPPPPAPTWGAPQQGSAPVAPNFGFQMPGWPQQPPTQALGSAAAPPPPPPPPGWPGATQGQVFNNNNNSNAFMNPALLAALMSHMQGQQQQGGQQQWQPPGGQGQ